MFVLEMNLGKYYVYYHRVGDEVFYVGMGKNGRLLAHDLRGMKWHERVEKNNGKFTAEIVSWFPGRRAAEKFETKEIKRLHPSANIKHNSHYVSSPPKKIFITKLRENWPKEMYVLWAEQGITHEIIGQQFGVTKQRVSQIIKKFRTKQLAL